MLAYVGDAERDVEAAVAAGMKALIANYGYLDARMTARYLGRVCARIDTRRYPRLL